MTFPHGCGAGHLKNGGIAARFIKPGIHALGVTGPPSPRGSTLRAYDEERTLRGIVKGGVCAIQLASRAMKSWGGAITPREAECAFRPMFDEREIPVLARGLEAMLAERLETALSRNIASARPRDFYDIHALCAMRGGACDMRAPKQALSAAAARRGGFSVLPRHGEIVASIKSSPQTRGFWDKYR
jgi:hypothetical protein